MQEILGQQIVLHGYLFLVDEIAVHTENGKQYAAYRPLEEAYLDRGCTHFLRSLEKALTLDKAVDPVETSYTPTGIAIPLGRYQHFKRNFYEVVGIGLADVKLVLYKPLYDVDLQENTCLARPLEMFLEEINRPEFNYQGPRFWWCPLD